MKPIYAFNDYLYEVWPLDQYARNHLVVLCETLNYQYNFSPTTMGSDAFRYTEDICFSVKEKLSK